MITFNPKYKRYQTVYHATIDSERGIILDIKYHLSTNKIYYLVAVGWNNEVWAVEDEISESKILI